jgi:hypothetical protein
MMMKDIVDPVFWFGHGVFCSFLLERDCSLLRE